MKKVLVMVGVGATLLCVTVGGLLFAQGRWNYEGTRHIPLLNRLFQAPPEPKVPAAHRAAKAIAKSSPKNMRTGAPPTNSRETRVQPAALNTTIGTATAGMPTAASATATEDKAAKRVPAPGLGPDAPTAEGPRSLFQFTSIEASGMSVAEVNAIVERAREMQLELQGERAELQRWRADLKARERDLEARNERIAQLMQEVLDERSRLERAVEDFNRRVIALPIDEAAALRGAAATIAKLTPEAGAEMILGFWSDPGGRERAVKLLAVMDKDRADEIIACLDTKRAREILEARMGVVRKSGAVASPGKESPQ